MEIKEISTRIINKHDSSSNWEQKTDFCPKKGELIIYDSDSLINNPKIKIGDGSTPVTNLPFFRGEPGKTPQKGIDYWTTQDKNDIINEVLTQLPLAKIYTGSSTPTADLGKDGDIYLTI